MGVCLVMASGVDEVRQAVEVRGVTGLVAEGWARRPGPGPVEAGDGAAGQDRWVRASSAR